MLRCLLEVLVGGLVSPQGGISWALGATIPGGMFVFVGAVEQDGISWALVEVDGGGALVMTARRLKSTSRAPSGEREVLKLDLAAWLNFLD